jgi:hypothetical protein
MLSWSAVATKSATLDEPLHAYAAYTHAFARDFAVNPEDPPLWKIFAMLPHDSGELKLEAENKRIVDSAANYVPAARALFHDPAVNGAAFINRSRAMMLLLGIALGSIIMIWAWQVGGPTAAVIAGAFYCLDPNFIAHAPLVKNDIAISLVMFAMVFAIYRFGQRMTPWSAAAAILLCAVGPTIKFSGLLLLPLLVLLLFVGALMIDAHRRNKRLLITGAMSLGAVLVTWLLIWLSYGFRFLPTTSSAQFSFDPQIEIARENAYYVKHNQWSANARGLSTPLLCRMLVWTNDHRVLPQAWLFGLLYTYQNTLVRPGYLLGEIRDTGRWNYFPATMLFKTPLATLVALAIAVLMLIRGRLPNRWLAVCIAGSIVLYGYNALTTSLNLGLRHVLPLYPFLFLIIAMALARPARARYVIGLIFALAAETVSTYPDLIPFFNVLSRPHRLGLLSDSNLDWGQDLPALAHWQQLHPDQKLYLCYFGSADPAFYGIEYTNLPSGYFLSPTAELPTSPGVIAVSATKLQGLYVYDNVRDFYAALRARPPREILHGTIYLYDWPARR